MDFISPPTSPDPLGIPIYLFHSSKGSFLSTQQSSSPIRRRVSKTKLNSNLPEQNDGKQENTTKENTFKKKEFLCSFPGCDKIFNRRGNMTAHLKTHDPNRERNFVCDVCFKGFSRPHDLQRHSTVHSGVKGFHCPVCFKQFTRRDAIMRHGELGCYMEKPEEFAPYKKQ